MGTAHSGVLVVGAQVASAASSQQQQQQQQHEASMMLLLCSAFKAPVIGFQ
jgi:hypothetical protein